ncbi:tetratricopeptide repeat protein [Candidatus Ponderosibacter sp. Uisw_141_02]|uniref:tetratricopeptide repeat protein n=1 Tax=Candidatus Ponderosibacter sp. Uisw_141_02 TaxID=3231000 RepID=UPI003D435614
MTPFGQSKPETTGCNDRKNALNTMVSSSSFCTASKTKIEQADALNSQDKLEKAYEIYKDLLGLDTRHADALCGIGVILEKQQKFDLAVQFLTRAIESNPFKIQALLTRGRILRLQGKTNNAILDFAEVLAKHPDNFEALVARGIAFGQTSHFDKAIDDFNSAIRVNSNRAEAFYNRGVAYEKLYEFGAAIEDYSIAIKLNPHDYKAFNNRGVAWRETKCFDAAIKDFDKSVEINPDFAEGFYNKSLTLLSVGALDEGFKLFEYRWKTAHFQSQIRHFFQPLWLGDEDLRGKTILIHSEQGLGDSIQFCRYIKFFEKMKCRVLLEIEKPLMSLMQSLLPREYIFEKGSGLPKFDFHCPLMSLPHAFRTRLNDVPFSSPYLSPQGKQVERWQQRLKGARKPSIGLAWRGNPNHVNDHRRSAKLDELVGFLSTDCEWVSLEKFPTPQEVRLIEKTKHVKQFATKMGDFAETAALCSALDGVIAVDTSAAHLAASVGINTHLFIRDCADWRWFQNRPDTPWYSSMTLHRKPDSIHWGRLVEIAVKDIIQKK